MGEAIAEVERRGVSSPTEAEKRRDRRMPFGFAERHDRDAQFPEQRFNFTDRVRAATTRKDHAGLNRRRRADPDVVSGEDAVDEIEMSVFTEQNRDERRRVERHTPPGP